MYDRWVKAAAQGQVSGVILLDLSAAFGLVEPEPLIQKLRIYIWSGWGLFTLGGKLSS